MKLVIIGASGHGKVVADVAKKKYSEIVFLDNNPDITECAGYSVLSPDALVRKLEGDVFVAIGNSETRRKLMEREKDRNFPVLIHQAAVVSEDSLIGAGSVIMACAVVNPGTKIGKGCIVNTGSSIDHDCSIGDYSHVSVGAHLCGTVTVGEGTWIGAGATVINNVTICGGCIIGAGAVVIRNIDEPGTYVGIPAKKKR